MNKGTRSLLYILGAIIVLLALWYFRTLVAYVLMAVVVAFVARPITKLLGKVKMGKRHLPDWLIAGVALFALLTLAVGFAAIFAPLIADQAKKIASIDLEQTAAQLDAPISQLEDWLSQFNLSGDDMSNRDFLILQLKEVIDFKDLSNVLNNLFGVLGNAFIALFSVLFMSFFFIKDSTLFKRAILSTTPTKHSEKMEAILTNTKRLLTRYFVGICIQILIVTAIVSIGLSIAGVENALLIGFLAGLLNLIPYVGPILGAIVGIIIALTSHLEMDFFSEMLPLAGKVVLVFASMQLIDNFFTQPYVFSNSVKAHPLEIFLVISIGGMLAGIWGMVLAIPAYTFLRIIAKEFLSQFRVVQSLTKGI